MQFDSINQSIRAASTNPYSLSEEDLYQHPEPAYSKHDVFPVHRSPPQQRRSSALYQNQQSSPNVCDCRVEFQFSNRFMMIKF